MDDIKKFLNTYTNITPPDDVVRETFIHVCHDVCGIHLSKNDIRIIGKTAYLQIDPICKQEIILELPLILINLEKILGLRRVEAVK